jgi:RNA polymerase sigma-70 factor (ECF subfamily)
VDRSSPPKPLHPSSLPATPLADDRTVVAALRQGDERTFVAIVERYHAALVRLALTYVHDRAVAEEVAQEAWLGMLTGLPRFAGRASLRTWLFQILINCARASHRREAHAIPFSTLGEEDNAPSVEPERFHAHDHRWAGHWSAPPQPWPEEHLLATEVGSEVESAIRRLPPHQRAVLTLRDVEGLTAAEVCQVLGISDANERVLLHRARSRVRQALETYLQATEGAADAHC